MTARFRVVQAFAFLGAFLLFVLEPLAGKLLLPRYGGSFLTWATCLAFFQGALFFGYLYAHVIAPRIGRAHVFALLAPLVCLPLDLGTGSDLERPVLAITRTLALGIGLPFLALASTAVVAQRWLALSRLTESARPYQLYAISNVGSLLALLSYPLLVEPLVGLETQRRVWTAGYLGYVVLAAAAAWVTRSPTLAVAPTPALAPQVPTTQVPATPVTRVSPGRVVSWVLLSAGPSAFLVAVNNVLTTDVAVLPLLWVLPLALYLGSFILAFREPAWCPSVLRRNAAQLALTGIALYLSGALTQKSALAMGGAVAVHLGVLFVVGLVSHTELAASRPDPSRATGYYLAIAFGGWVGGLAATLVPPLVATSLVEYPCSLALVFAVLATVRRVEIRRWLERAPRPERVLSLVLLLLAGSVAALSRPDPVVDRVRSFYGIYTVEDTRGQDTRGRGVRDDVRLLFHGSTLHGLQVLNHPDVAGSYYGPRSPVKDVLDLAARPRRAGLIGLGAGVLATYFGAGERATFYEIDGDEEKVARRYFTFLSRSPAEIRVVTGDARIMLADAPDQSLDVLVADAFSGHSVPSHLLTREALELYTRKVTPSGLVAFHVTNRFLDLRPTLAAVARSLGLAWGWRTQTKLGALEDGDYDFPSRWFVTSREPALLEPLRARGWTLGGDTLPVAGVWTDDLANSLEPIWNKLGDHEVTEESRPR